MHTAEIYFLDDFVVTQGTSEYFQVLESDHIGWDNVERREKRVGGVRMRG
jgi:hypothetical protein